MSKKRQQKQIEEITELQADQKLCIVKGVISANVFECSDGISDVNITAELPQRFRKTIWIRRGQISCPIMILSMKLLILLVVTRKLCYRDDIL